MSRRSGPWDLVVLGAGAAGIVAAKTATGFGARVLLIDERPPGGDCLWTGCVPSKALLAAAESAAGARRAAVLGVHCQVRVDAGDVLAHVRQSIATIAPKDSAATLEREGITVRLGRATLTGPRTVDVDGTPIGFRRAVLAFGARPSLPPVPGLADSGALTSDTIWDLTAFPDQLVVIGGGSIGCELAQGFARLGCQVTVLEAAGRLLSAESQAASRLITAALRADGVEVVTGAAVTAVMDERVQTSRGESYGYDRLLVAVGRSPRTADVGLDSAGVETDGRGFVRVNGQLRTTNPRIWAAGDLTGHPQFTHTAGVHGSIAASNAVLGLRRTADVSLTPRVTFTRPEVAAVGIGPDEAGTASGLRLLSWEHAQVDRAVTDADTLGRTDLVVDRRGRIVGASIVGPRAGESLAEVVLAARTGLKAREVAATTHPYPTYGDAVWNAGISDVQRRLQAPLPRLALTLLVRGRRLLAGRPR